MFVRGPQKSHMKPGPSNIVLVCSKECLKRIFEESHMKSSPSYIALVRLVF